MTARPGLAQRTLDHLRSHGRLVFHIPAQILGGHLYAVAPVLPFLAAVPAFVLSFFILLRIHEPAHLER